MKELRIEKPTRDDVLEWEDESLEYFRDEKWLGKPEISTEAYVLNSRRPISAENMSRLEPYVENSELFVVFRDIDNNSWLENFEDRGFQRKHDELIAELDSNIMDMPTYVKKLDEFASDDITEKFFFSDISYNEMISNKEVAEEIQDLIIDNKNYVLTGVDLRTMARSDDAVVAYDELEDNLSFKVHFRYGGNEEATKNYNDIISGYGDQGDYSGVPGTFVVGEGQAFTYLPYSSEINLSYSEIEGPFRNEMEEKVVDRNKKDE